ncbi:late embryogenesis abundant protein At5g17165-like isoform X2 [Vicia villosa]|uniref:late embryogenesis abundant protein At5g17165-like isoform X2 n=1 Tax=Vicia villosa TaxID=3911 RepID=UPI00273C52CD|nr:late embryogenesis abundant protein At5g17165-like isoform X2 [Vicia villosa]
MATNSSSRSFSGFGKRVFNQIWNSNSKSSLPTASRRAAYSSLYDKNADDHNHSGPVPDDVIQAAESTKYWAPHPQTGVFGPPGEQATAGFHSASTADATAAAAAAGSVLEEKAWFRPISIEDLEKPHSHP